jgi:alpha-mannosidase
METFMPAPYYLYRQYHPFGAEAMKKPRVHLICNAHLDPVWQWRWEEGCAEALSTFKTAARLLEEHDGLIFNHNESLLYRWVEAYDPDLFSTIKALVKQGRWFICGGWYLQPDMNLPGLESLFRQIAEGRRYFMDRFDAFPRAAVSFDAFGHHGGLPQVLRLFGYEMYIHLRPEEMDLPDDLYRWRGVDGSEILAHRIAVGLYHTERDNIEERLEQGMRQALEKGRDAAVFWGLGNHGGGATREDLKRIDAFMDRHREVRFLHSTPDRFLEAVRGLADFAPVVSGDLQRAFTGCYTSASRLKRAARMSLGRLVQAEALCAAAWWQGAELNDLEPTWRAHLFNDFHDILPGTCIEPAERDALDLYGRVSERARRARFSSAVFFSRLPVVVLNSNPALTRVPVEVELQADYRPFRQGEYVMEIRDDQGRRITVQEEQPEALLPFNGWRRKLCFKADLPGLGAAHYRVKALAGCGKEAETVKPDMGFPFEPVVMHDQGDSWGTGCRRWHDEAGRFEVTAKPRVIARGPVRSVVESLHTHAHSQLRMQVITYADWPVTEVRMRLKWNEVQKRLKLKVRCPFETDRLECEIPGGIIDRPADGEEHVHGRWLVLRSEGRALAVVNSGQHGVDIQGGQAYLSVLRSAAYCHERGFDLAGPERKYMDQGVHEFKLLVTTKGPEELSGLADWLDAPPAVYAHLPSRRGRRPAHLDLFESWPSSVRMLACKPSWDHEALVIRLHETAGRAAEALKQSFNPFEIKTLRLERNGACRAVDPASEK